MLDLFLFTAPLAFVVITTLLSRQISMAGLAWYAGRTGANLEVDLAAFVVALSLTWLAIAPLPGLGMLALSWGSKGGARVRIVKFAVALAALSTGFTCWLTFTGSGRMAIMLFQGLSEELAARVQYALQPMAIFPLVAAVLTISGGILRRRGQSGRLAFFNFLGIMAVIGSIFAGPLLGWPPLIVASIALMSGHAIRAVCGLVAVLLGNRTPAVGAEDSTDDAEDSVPPTWWRLVVFYLPVTCNFALMVGSRPIIQWFLAKTPDPEIALAGFGVAVLVAQVLYGWLNDLRTHAVAFRNRPAISARLPHFATLLCAGMTIIMALLFWTPLNRELLTRVMGLHGEVLEQSVQAMYVLVVIPLVVTVRAYHQGLALKQKQTVSWLTSAVVRVTTIVLVMVLLPLVGVHGAILGAAGLAGGFLAEALCIAWALRGTERVEHLVPAVASGR